jgi:hypothetical protein
MLLLSSLALAAPLAPIVDSQPAGSFSVLVAGSKRTDHRRQQGCATGQCLALVVDTGWRGLVEYRPLSFLSVWGEVGWSAERVRAALYEGGGVEYGGGLKAGLPLRPWLGVDLWGSYTGWSTAEAEGVENHRRGELDLGASLRLGSSDSGLVGWVGPVVSPWNNSTMNALDGAVPLTLLPSFPLSATAGALFVSNPLGPIWSERGRMSLGVGGTVGNRVGVDFWLGFLW